MNKLAHTLALLFLVSSVSQADEKSVGAEKTVASPSVIEHSSVTDVDKFGPQSPRDLSKKGGQNTLHFSPAPSAGQMNLCNIHFHKNAEHKWGEFSTYAGRGDGHGYQTGFKYSGKLNLKES